MEWVLAPMLSKPTRPRWVKSPILPVRQAPSFPQPHNPRMVGETHEIRPMPKRIKTRQSLEEILASCSDTLFPAQMGKAIVNITSTDVDGDTPLHVLVWRENIFGVKCLIAAGADVNAIGDMSETSLHVAVRQDNAEIISLLLENGAEPDIRSEFDQTPRSMAEARGGGIRRLFVDRSDGSDHSSAAQRKP